MKSIFNYILLVLIVLKILVNVNSPNRQTLSPSSSLNNLEIKNGDIGVYVFFPWGKKSEYSIRYRDGSFEVNEGDVVLVSEKYYPNISFKTEQVSQCIGVAIRAEKDGEVYYGLAHIYDRDLEHVYPIEKIFSIHNYIKTQGFTADNISYLIDYRPQNQADKQKTYREAALDNAIVVLHPRFYNDSVADTIDVNDHQIVISPYYEGTKIFTYSWDNIIATKSALFRVSA